MKDSPAMRQARVRTLLLLEGLHPTSAKLEKKILKLIDEEIDLRESVKPDPRQLDMFKKNGETK